MKILLLLFQLVLIRNMPVSTNLHNRLQNMQEIAYKEVEIGCLNLGQINTQTIITSKEEYARLFESLSSHPDCGSYLPPSIDFENEILLGFKINSKGCSNPEYSKNIYRLDGETVFRVETKENGMCKMLFQKIFWITIPREFNNNMKFIYNKK